jgi:flagellar biosynthesis protein FlhF
MLRASGPVAAAPGKPSTVALIGPTGVGKTTTIAKLAADFKFRKGLKVGLITIDTYRIAAVEQLKTYADIIGIPINVVLTPEELAGAVQAFGEMDVVLVDTAGRSQCDSQKMDELRAFLDAACFDEVHLVVSSTTQTTLLESIVERFGPLAHDRLILTKMDETTCRGHLLNVLLRVNKAVSYVTTGQEVPDDIEVADPARIAAIVLGA